MIGDGLNQKLQILNLHLDFQLTADHLSPIFQGFEQFFGVEQPERLIVVIGRVLISDFADLESGKVRLGGFGGAADFVFGALPHFAHMVNLQTDFYVAGF